MDFKNCSRKQFIKKNEKRKKRPNHKYTKQQEWILKYLGEKKASLKRIHTIWFHLYEILISNDLKTNL